VEVAMKMWRVVLVPIYLLVMVATGLAASYEMLLNQNDKLCTTVLNLINEDLKRNETIRYDTHTIFADIKWKPISEVLRKGGWADDDCQKHRYAHFDFNNDGRVDIVVKMSGCADGHFTDKIFFLNVTHEVFPAFDFDDIMSKSTGEFPPLDRLSWYILKTPLRGTQGKMPESVGGWNIIHPFLYNKLAYLAITDRGIEGRSQFGEGFLIGKYKSSEELDEVCYFKQK
jgi:hypothetical protein